jgi:hypothetical protein
MAQSFFQMMMIAIPMMTNGGKGMRAKNVKVNNIRSVSFESIFTTTGIKKT